MTCPKHARYFRFCVACQAAKNALRRQRRQAAQRPDPVEDGAAIDRLLARLDADKRRARWSA